MDLSSYHRNFIIRRQNPAANLYGDLLRFGLKEGQIKGILRGRRVADVRCKLYEIAKLDFPNRTALFLKEVGKLPRIKKPRQLKLLGAKQFRGGGIEH